MTDPNGNRRAALSFFELVGKGELDSAVALFTPDARYWNPGLGETDVAGMRGLLQGAIGLVDGPMQMTIHGAIAEGDAVAVEASSAAKLKSGARYANAYCFLFRFEAGRIASLREYCDTEPTKVFAGD